MTCEQELPEALARLMSISSDFSFVIAIEDFRFYLLTAFSQHVSLSCLLDICYTVT